MYSTFNRYGRKKPTFFIRKIEDRFGRTLEDHTAFDDAWAPLQDRVASAYARLFEPGEQVMAPETGFIMTHLMRGVVQEGTGAPAGPAPGQARRGQDGHHERLVRHVVLGLHAGLGDGGVGGL